MLKDGKKLGEQCNFMASLVKTGANVLPQIFPDRIDRIGKRKDKKKRQNSIRHCAAIFCLCGLLHTVDSSALLAA
jgi:hypothetical protein